MVVYFFSRIHANIPSREDADRLRWTLNWRAVFDTSSYYCVLQPPTEVSFPWKSIWGVKAPKRVSFFGWEATCGKILTCDNLMRQGFLMVGWCCMCRCSEEQWTICYYIVWWQRRPGILFFRSFGVTCYRVG
jgi:hypothetical protein